MNNPDYNEDEARLTVALQKTQFQLLRDEAALNSVDRNLENALEKLKRARTARRQARQWVAGLQQEYITNKTESTKAAWKEACEAARIYRVAAFNAEAAYELHRTHYTKAYDAYEHTYEYLEYLEGLKESRVYSGWTAYGGLQSREVPCPGAGRGWPGETRPSFLSRLFYKVTDALFSHKV